MARAHVALIAGVLLVALIGTASSVRTIPEAVPSGGSLLGASKTWISLLRMGKTITADKPVQPTVQHHKGKGEDDDDTDGLRTRIFAIKFIVPPSEGDNFEEAWGKLADKVEKEEDVDIFNLKATKLDNVLYFSYSEFAHHDDLHEHLTSDHFEDFAEFVDDKGIKWELLLLENLSEELEEDEEDDRDMLTALEKRGRKERKRDDDDDKKDKKKKKKDDDDDNDDERKDDQADDWDDNIPEDYRHFIPDKFRPKHKDDKDKKDDKKHRKDDDKKDRKLTRGSKKDDDDNDDDDDTTSGGDQEPADWDDNVPEDYRHFIPGKHRPKHKKGDRKAELSKAVLATAPQADAQQVKKLFKDNFEDDENAHVLINYIVPPGKGEDFVQAWTKAAEKTIEEKGNRIYSLRKIATDNTRFWAYGTWESMRDYLEHFDSKHVGKLLDQLDDMDVIYTIFPLAAVYDEDDEDGRPKN